MDTQLTVADIANIKTLLEAACARGSFRANEMSQVGQIYDKLSLFLEQAASQVQQHTKQPQGEPNA
jgi:hypothetical protein